MVRKIVSTLMISLLVIHLAGFYVYFIVRLGEIRMTMREKLAELPDDQLQILRIPANQFKQGWMEEREMEWQGNMYDIARVERSESILFVYCLQDQDEDDLLSILSSVVEMSSQDTRQAPASVTQFFTLEYVVAGINWSPVSPVSMDVRQSSYNFHFTPINPIPSTPPPRG